MIQKLSTVSVGAAASTGKFEKQIDIENCSPFELEKYISEMYKRGEISLKDTLVFHPLDLNPLAKELGISSSDINLKYFSKIWNNADEKRNLLRDYKSILNQMVIDRETSENISMMKDAVKLLERIKNSKSFSSLLSAVG